MKNVLKFGWKLKNSKFKIQNSKFKIQNSKFKNKFEHNFWNWIFKQEVGYNVRSAGQKNSIQKNWRSFNVTHKLVFTNDLLRGLEFTVKFIGANLLILSLEIDGPTIIFSPIFFIIIFFYPNSRKYLKNIKCLQESISNISSVFSLL